MSGPKKSSVLHLFLYSHEVNYLFIFFILYSLEIYFLFKFHQHNTMLCYYSLNHHKMVQITIRECMNNNCPKAVDDWYQPNYTKVILAVVHNTSCLYSNIDIMTY